MKSQLNSMTKMHWVYIPTAIARLLGIKKGDDIEFIKLDELKSPVPKDTIVMRKTLSTNQTQTK